jgi:hypothetical protein
MPRSDTYPQFRTITANLSVNPDDYEEVMQDVMVDRSGRYTIVSQPKRYWDVKDGSVHVTMDVIDNGPT